MDIDPYRDDVEERDWQRTTSGTVRFAMIGLGWWTTEFALPAVAESALCEATVLVSGSTEKAQRVAAGVGTVDRAVSYEDFHDGRATEAYDAVYVCSPNALHLPFAETAARLGKAVLCEKPLEASRERARSLVSRCQASGVPLVVAYRMQVEPAIRRAREAIRDGAIGDPVHATGTNSQRLLALFDSPDQWRLDPDMVGPGSTLTDIGIYPLNTARFLLDADPVAVQGFTRSPDDAFAAVPDEHAAFTVQYSDGTYLAATASQHAQETTSLRIVGTDGEIYVEPAFHMETSVRLTHDGQTVDICAPGANQLVELFDYTGDRVLTGADIGPDGEHGLHDVTTIEAIYEAAKTEQTVRVG